MTLKQRLLFLFFPKQEKETTATLFLETDVRRYWEMKRRHREYEEKEFEEAKHMSSSFGKAVLVIRYCDILSEIRDLEKRAAQYRAEFAEDLDPDQLEIAVQLFEDGTDAVKAVQIAKLL